MTHSARVYEELLSIIKLYQCNFGRKWQENKRKTMCFPL